MRSTKDAWLRSLDNSTVIEAGKDAGARTIRVPALTIIAHPDLSRVGARVVLPALSSRRKVELSRRLPTFAQPGERTPVPLSDPRLSRRPLALRVTGSGLRVDRQGYAGPVEINGEALGEETAIPATALDRGVTLLLGERVALLLHTTDPVVERSAARLGMIGDSDAICELRRGVLRAAGRPVSVLVTGETGTGKELVARAIHRASERSSQPYVVVNMAAIPVTLAAAELFGTVRGAFTGADRRVGTFRQAHGGTLFLDEIGETSPEIQPLLLRALESGEIQPVGADVVERVDVRVIAATDVDLEAEAAAGRFRAPLLHRLRGWQLDVPRLSDRPDDIARLLIHFLGEALADVGAEHLFDDPGPHGAPWLPAAVVARLVRATWPGNVRQLRQVAHLLAIEGHDRAQASISDTRGAQIGLQEASAEPNRADVSPSPEPGRRHVFRSPKDVTDDELVAALKEHRWRLQPTAAALDVSRTALYTLIDRCPTLRKAVDVDAGEIEQALEDCSGDLDRVARMLEVSRHGLMLRMRDLKLAIPRSSRPSGYHS